MRDRKCETGEERDSDSNGEEDEKGRQRWGEEGRQREGVGGLKPRRRNGGKKTSEAGRLSNTAYLQEPSPRQPCVCVHLCDSFKLADKQKIVFKRG